MTGVQTCALPICQHGIIKLDLKKETHANVTIKSDEGAMIYLNGELLGVTSVKRRLKYDLYELIIELNGEKVLRRMRIDEFSPAVLEAPIAGKLCIASKQQDVSVKINGAESQCLAAVGETPVTVSKEGYKTVNKTIHVDPFESKLVNINLKKLSRVRLWVEYNYSESANLSGTVGIAGKVGVYGRYKGNTGRRVDNVIHDVYNKESDMSEFQKKKAFRESITGGLMLRPINWFFIYGGMGQGKYYKIYEDLNGDYYSTRHINKGMEWEVGAVVRLGSIAVSYGYSQMKKNKDKIGEVNFGVGFMF